MVERLARDSVEFLQARGDRLGIGEHAAGLGQPDAVDLGDRFARAPVLSRGGEIAVRRPELVVGLAVLVDQPDDLVVVAGGIGRESRRDHGVDPPARDLGQIEAPPGKSAPNEIEALPLDERHADKIRLDAGEDELFRQPPDVTLRAPLGEGGLNGPERFG